MIAFIPGSDGTHKHWRTESWRRLAQMLSERGWNIVVLGEPERCGAVQELIDTGLRWRQTATIGDAVDILSCCSAAIGVDTGLTHIAAQQSTPTVALYKQGSIYYRPYPHTRSIESQPCAEPCSKKFLSRAINKITSFGTEFDPQPWTCEIPSAERCMSTITPDEVLSSLEQVQLWNAHGSFRKF
jgi:ADP-heptose:LPS heptosyltransferase